MKLKNALLLLLTATIWGVAFVAQRVGKDHVGPFTFNAVRSMIGGLVLLPVIVILDREKAGSRTAATAARGAGLAGKAVMSRGREDTAGKAEASEGANLAGKAETSEGADLAGKAETAGSADPTGKTGAVRDAYRRKDLILGGISCGILLCAASNFQQFGVKYSTVGKAGFITACYIILVPILGLFLKKKCSPAIWLAVVMATAGLYLLCMEGDRFSISKGDLLLFVCAVLFSFHILVIDHFTLLADGVKMSCIQFFVCGLLSAVAMLLFEEPRWQDILSGWMPILYAGVMSCGVAYTLQIVGQKGMDPTISSLILSLESSISVLAGWAILGQRMNGYQLAGCGAMAAAIVLAQLPATTSCRIPKKRSY